MAYSPLLRSLFSEPDKTLYRVVEDHLANGQDPNAGSSYGEMPFIQAFRRGRMDVVALLMAHGADLAPMSWGALHNAVALGSLRDVRRVAEAKDMSARDVFGLTPFLLACDIGDVEKAAVLLPLSKPEDTLMIYHRVPALTVAARKGRTETVAWLLANGFDVNEPDEFGGTALIAAAEMGKAEIVTTLLEAGADIEAKFALSASLKGTKFSESSSEPFLLDLDQAEREFFKTAASETQSADVARLLIRAGVEPGEFENSVLRDLTGASLIPEQRISPAIYEAQKNRVFGTTNPEPVSYEFWLEMLRLGEPGYWARQKFGDDYCAPATWSFSRFGMSTTALPDNAWVQIAGEHEDHYDPDFCIYNDVVVHDGKGNARIFIYPRDIFPPTDFHTATLVDGAIIVIGSLGYPQDRRVGQTQVLRLDLNDFSIREVETSGKPPGWISRHRARSDGDRITVWDGEVWDGSNMVPMEGRYELILPTGTWKKSSGE